MNDVVEAKQNESQSTWLKVTGNQILDGGILLSIATAWGYGVALFFENGYATYWGIPQVFIEADLTKLLWLVPALPVLYLLLYWVVLWGILPVVQSSRIPFSLGWRLAAIPVLLSVVAFSAVVYGEIRWHAVTLVLFSLAMLFFLPLIQTSSRPGFLGKLEAQDKVDAAAEEQKPSQLRWSRSIHSRFALILFAAWFSLEAAQGIGYYTARTKTSFSELVNVASPTNSTRLVILNRVGPSLICAKVDSTGTLDSTFVLLGKDALRDEGRLTVRESKLRIAKPHSKGKT